MGFPEPHGFSKGGCLLPGREAVAVGEGVAVEPGLRHLGLLEDGGGGGLAGLPLPADGHLGGQLLGEHVAHGGYCRPALGMVGCFSPLPLYLYHMGQM